MSVSASSTNEIARRGLLKISDATVLAGVDALHLRGNSKVSAVVGMPLRGLQQRRDVTAFATSAPIAAVKALIEILAARPLDQVIELLGDHADAPSFDQLAAAVEQLVENGSTTDDVVALLVFAVVQEFPAAPHCRVLLGEREQFRLPEITAIEPTLSLLSPKVISPEIREQRRTRREREKRKKKDVTPTRTSRTARARATPPISIAPIRATTAVEVAAVVERRRTLLTPAEQEEFRADHSLTGTVVMVEVPFDSVDPNFPEQRIKERPALIVAASPEGILVRGIYSNPSATRALFSPWRRLGLDHVSYIDDARLALKIGDSGEFLRLGRLTDVEWNAVH